MNTTHASTTDSLPADARWALRTVGLAHSMERRNHILATGAARRGTTYVKPYASKDLDSGHWQLLGRPEIA